jgi:AcrR family transcriptional regulator
MSENRPSLRQEQTKLTRRRIANAARGLFIENGVGDTTIDEIARAAGTSRVTFYAHFRDKDAVIREMMSEMWDADVEIFEDFAKLPDVSPKSIREWLKRFFPVWDVESENTRFLNTEFPAQVWEEAPDYLKRVVSILLSRKERWQHFTPEEAKCHAYLLVIQLNTGLARWHSGGWASKQSQVLDVLTDIWLSTLSPKRVKLSGQETTKNSTRKKAVRKSKT